MNYRRLMASCAILPFLTLLWGSQPEECFVETGSVWMEFEAHPEDALLVEVTLTVQVPDTGVPIYGSMPTFLIPGCGEDKDEYCSETNGSIWTVDQCGSESEEIGGERYVNHVRRFEVSSEGAECDEETGEARCLLEGGLCEMTYLVEFTSLEDEATEYSVEIRADVHGFELCNVEDQSSIDISVAEVTAG